MSSLDVAPKIEQSKTWLKYARRRRVFLCPFSALKCNKPAEDVLRFFSSTYTQNMENTECVNLEGKQIIELKAYGWSHKLEEESKKIIETEGVPLEVGRITLDYGQKFKIITKDGEKWLQRPNQSEIQLAVGDWILASSDIYQPNEMHFSKCLSRKTKFSRMAAGIELKEQIVATNVDIVFLIQSLNSDFNPRRLERYLIATWESGAQPVVVLTKSDLCDEYNDKIMIVNDIAFGVDVHAVSSLTGEGLDAIKPYFKEGVTVALLGSSGVGKSTLVNLMMESEVLKTQEIRALDGKGRHTTTHRELMLLPDGGVIIDTPGMRSLALWDSEEGMTQMFGDIEKLLTECRFNNCSHKKEIGCAVQEAIKEGRLKNSHWESWVKLQSEQKHLERKMKQKMRIIEKANSFNNTKKESKKVAVRRATEEY